MEIKVNIPANDYVQPTEIRQEVVQQICDIILKNLNFTVNEGDYLCIVGENGIFAGQQVALNGPVTLGRGGANVLMYPPNVQGISRRHCVIEMQEGQPVLIDLGSSFGTFVNGNRIYSNTPIVLQNNDVISLADDNNTFRVLFLG